MRDRHPAGPDPRGHRLSGHAVDEQGGASGGVLAADHPAGLPAAHGPRGGRGADVQADGDHRRARPGRRAGVLADRVPGAGGDAATGGAAGTTASTAASSAGPAAATAACWTSSRRAPRRRWAGRRGSGPDRGAVRASLGAEFVPRLDEGELSLDIKRLPSISITEAQRLGVEVQEVLGKFPEVLSVVTRTGRAEVATDPVGPDETEVMVKLRPKEEWTTAHDLDDLGEAIKDAVEAQVPATFVSVSQPIEDRVNQLLAGSRADVVIKLFGQDLARAEEDGRRDRQGDPRRAGTRRLAGAAGAGPAHPRGHARSAAAGPLRHERRPGAGGGRGVARRPLLGEDLRGVAPVRSDAAPAAGDADPRGLRRAAGRLVGRPSGPAGVGGDHPRDGGAGRHQPRVAAAARAGRGQRPRTRSGQLRGRGPGEGRARRCRSPRG